MAAAPPALALAPHTAVFPDRTLAPPEPLTLRWHQGRVSAGLESLCADLLKGVPWISVSFCLTQMAGTPTDFYSQIFGEFISSALGSPCMVLGPLSLSEGPLRPRSPSSCSPARLTSSPLLLVSMWLLLYIIRCMCYDQLDFGWCSMLIIL